MRQQSSPDHSSDTPEKTEIWSALRNLVPYLSEFKGRVVLALLFLVAAKLANIGLPIIFKTVVDKLEFLDNDSLNSSPSDFGFLLLFSPILLVIAFGILRFSSVLFGEIRDTLFGRVTERAMRRIGHRVFKHLHALDLDFHLDRKTGGLSRDIERGTTGISFLMRFMVFNIAPTLFEIVVVVSILFTLYGIEFAAVTLISIAAYIFFSVVVTEWRNRFLREATKADSDSYSRAIDSLLNYETVKYYTNENFEANRYDFDLATWEAARRKNRLSLFALNIGQAFIIGASMTSMLYLATTGILNNTMKIGDLVLVNMYMMQLFIPLNFLGFVYREIKMSLINIEKMFGLLKVESKIKDADNASELQISQGKIKFENVNFSYQSKREILKQINFTVKAGETIAVVGASGSGKSTLVKLLFRFYDPSSGEISIDNQNIKLVSQNSLREMIGIVPQDTVLFNDTIFENIRYGRTDATEHEVQQAITMAHLDDFISQLPDGTSTAVGERGLKLSGGEKQRVAIARTILKKPPILIFDEATSSLDSKSEQMILRAINEIARDHTSLIIAHRLSTIVNADKIIVLDKGQIVEQGSHDELLDKKAFYFDLWMAQQKEG